MKCFFVILVSLSLCAQNNINDKKLKHSIEQICQGKYPNFHKTHSFYFKKVTDSAYLYCSEASLSDNSKDINDYIDFIYGVTAYKKGFYSIAKKKFNKISTDFPYMHLVYYNLGGIALETNNFNEALYFYDKATESQKIKSNTKLKIIYHNRGVIYLHLEQFDKAEEFLKKEKEINIQEKDTIGIIYSKLDIGNIYYEQYKDDIAISYFKDAYNLAQLISDFNVKQTTSENLAIVEKNRRNFESSMAYFEESMMWKDSIWNRDKVSLLVERDKQNIITLKQKEVELEKLKTETQREQRNWFIIGTAIFLLLSGVLFFVYRISIKQKKQLIKLNHLKDFLFSVVSHDLRSPLNLLEVKNKEIIDDLENNNLESAILRSKENKKISENTIHLLNNVLNWTLQENNQLQFYPESHTLKILISSWLIDFKSRSQNKKIIINNSVNENCFVLIDKELIKIAFRNLIDNAIKYIPNQGVIDINSKEYDSYCEIIISDNGPGISENILKELKENEDLSIEKVNRSKGIGLGLILCKKLVKLNKGSITFMNKPNNSGLKTIIKLPIAKV
ncbi:ATP-binding protein [Tenacibaculum sp. UWU-22]|uniref:tetratricopeptide repeat-containing sensor histidine kinase n=1 Tax=Tenacibaculum sp. UWU-22 TaxID=3234187 RepID=UPI0034DB0163